MTDPRAARLQTLEASRGVAALLVVLYHASEFIVTLSGHECVWGLFHFGQNGVTFFFVLSGFIITWRHAEDLGHPSRLPSFLRRRFVRVYPTYWVMLAVSLALYAWLKYPFLVMDHAPSDIARAVVLNYYDQPVVAVAWTLWYEVRFYLLFGLAILQPLLGRLAFLAWLGWGFNAYKLAFVLGVLAAVSARRFGGSRAAAGCAGILGLAGFVTAAGLEDYAGFAAITLVPFYAAAAALLVFALAGWEEHWTVRVPRALRILGAASYSIYLVHYTVQVLLMHWNPTFINAARPVHFIERTYWIYVAVPVAAGLAYHYAVERNVIRLTNGVLDRMKGLSFRV